MTDGKVEGYTDTRFNRGRAAEEGGRDRQMGRGGRRHSAVTPRHAAGLQFTPRLCPRPPRDLGWGPHLSASPFCFSSVQRNTSEPSPGAVVKIKRSSRAPAKDT